MESTIKLELQFKNGEGKAATVSIPHPVEGLDRATTEAAMQVIADSNLFAKEGVDNHATILGARYVSRTTEEIFKEA